MFTLKNSKVFLILEKLTFKELYGKYKYVNFYYTSLHNSMYLPISSMSTSLKNQKDLQKLKYTFENH